MEHFSPATPLNAPYERYKSILETALYKRMRAFAMPLASRDERLEWWTGVKGTVLIQVWRDGGATPYLDWSAGATFRDFERAL